MSLWLGASLERASLVGQGPELARALAIPVVVVVFFALLPVLRIPAILGMLLFILIALSVGLLYVPSLALMIMEDGITRWRWGQPPRWPEEKEGCDEERLRR